MTWSFSMAVSNINARIVQVLTDYTLNKIPVVETIRVFINGAEVAADAGSSNRTTSSSRSAPCSLSVPPK